VSARQDALTVIAGAPDARLVTATNATRARDRYVERLTEIAAEARMPVERLRPISATDWNDILRGRAE
jgi:hypothetical protein